MGAGEASENHRPVALGPLDGLFDFRNDADIKKIVIQRLVFENIFLRQQKDPAVGVIAECDIDGGAESSERNSIRKIVCGKAAVPRSGTTGKLINSGFLDS